jgi:hypothetical protein
MTSKRQKLNFDSQELTQNLKTSTGQGMNAFFTPSSEKKSEAPSGQAPTPVQQPADESSLKSSKRTNVRKNKRSNERKNKRTTEQMTVRPNGQTVKRTNVRKKIRHAFDIFEDQLFSLKEVQLSRQKKGAKYNLGNLVQEALDMFLTDERTKVRRNE